MPLKAAVAFAVAALALMIGLLTSRGAAAAGDSADAQAAIARVLDDLHKAASEPDEARYFSHYAPGAVFLGTDATERWTIEQFREYAHKRFSTGKGWTYVCKERHVSISPCGEVAWFDEVVVNQKYGACRGTGVLVRQGEAWKVAQYNLTLPIPNDMIEEVAQRISAAEQKP